MNPKVAIGCPVRNRGWILPEYLAALNNIDYGNKFYLFIENDSEDKSREHLYDFALNLLYKYGFEETSGNILIANESSNHAIPSHTRTGYNANQYGHLAELRNKFIDMFLQTDAEYLLSVDSDVIVPPDIIAKLLPFADDKTIVGAAISNIPDVPLDGHTPGNFMLNDSGVIKHPAEYKLTGIMDVDVIGACYLIPRKTLVEGIRYASHWQGEDVPFCQQAKARGYKMFVNMDCKPDHRMVEIK